MFQKIVVAYNDSPESERALTSAIQLAISLHAELQAVTIVGDLPSYTAYAGVADPSTMRMLQDDELALYEQLQAKARSLARTHGIELRSHLIEGHQVEAIVAFLRDHKADLLVIGLHQRDLYISRL